MATPQPNSIGPPPFVADLTFPEAQAVLAAVQEVDELSEAELMWFVSWLEVNFPGSNFSDLIYWPNH